MSRQITHREMEIAELISFGLTEKEISNYLEISFFTLRTHKRNLFNKTGCRNIADVTRWYIQEVSGIKIEPREPFKKMVSIFMLILIIIAEFSSGEFVRSKVRIKTITPRTVRSNRRVGKKRETLQLKFA